MATPIRTPDVNNKQQRIELTDKQRQFFFNQRSLMQQVEAAMKGALQLICDEKEVRGKVALTEDFSAILVEPEEQQAKE